MTSNTLRSSIAALAVALLTSIPAAQTPPAAGYTDRFATVNGLRLHYLEWGSSAKPAMVLLHGISKHAHTFDHIAPEFARDYHVLAVDMRGHGDSGWSPEGAYLVEDYVKDIEGLLAQLGIRKVTMLGNSTGGRVVQVFAGMHPEMVDRLIVEDVGPERPQDIADSFARQVRQEADGWASEDELVKQLVGRSQRTPEALTRTYAHFGTKKREDGRIVWKRDPNLVKGFVVTELWTHVSKITSPTLYVIGGGSRIVPAATQERLKQTLPKVEIVTMPGLGHYPNEENTAGFLAIVNPFLKR
jgi:pimeloyl-ACP methyl ester carboxylesterase